MPDKPSGFFQQVSLVIESSLAAGAQPAVTSFMKVIRGSENISPQMQGVANPKVQLGHPGRSFEARGRLKPGTFSFDIYPEGSGSAGTVPAWFSALMLSARLSETTDPGVSITYAWDSRPSKSCQVYLVNDNECEILLGCLITQIKFAITTNGDDPLKMTISGTYARKLGFSKTTLDGGIDDTVTSLVIGDTENVSTGLKDTTSTGLYLPLTIESEQVIATAYNDSTGALTISRGDYSSSAAAHSDGVDIEPYKPTPTWPSGEAYGADDWTFTWDGASEDITDKEFTIDTGIKYEEVESSNIQPETYTIGEPMASGTFGAYAKDGNAYWYKQAEKRSEKALVLTLGSTAGSIITLTIPRARLQQPDRAEGTEGTRKISRNYDCFDQETVLGAFTLACT